VETRRRHVAVVLSSSDAMRADTLGHLDVFDTTQRAIRVSSADAADRLADTLADLRTMQPILMLC